METTKLIYTDKEIEQWINKTDPDLLIETWESYDPDVIDEEIEFNDLYQRYQEKHLQKYNCTLSIDLE